MQIILLGAPGAGKGTQAQFIEKRYGIPSLSTGQILRDFFRSQSQFGKKDNLLINTGKLVSDDLVITLIKKRIQEDDCYNGFILDGFPRTLPQANEIKKLGMDIDFVLDFLVPDTMIKERILGRRVYAHSGKIYHMTFNPPKKEDLPTYGKKKEEETLITRHDDREDVISTRLMEYYQHTIPVIDLYRNESNLGGKIRYFAIDASQKIEEINAIITSILD